MWIRSQNKKGLIEAICVTCSGYDDTYRLYADAIGFEDYVLGTYHTEARALEVLDEIQRHVQNLEILHNGGLNVYEVLAVYEMPKE